MSEKELRLPGTVLLDLSLWDSYIVSYSDMMISGRTYKASWIIKIYCQHCPVENKLELLTQKYKDDYTFGVRAYLDSDTLDEPSYLAMISILESLANACFHVWLNGPYDDGKLNDLQLSYSIFHELSLLEMDLEKLLLQKSQLDAAELVGPCLRRLRGLFADMMLSLQIQKSVTQNATSGALTDFTISTDHSLVPGRESCFRTFTEAKQNRDFKLAFQSLWSLWLWGMLPDEIVLTEA